MPARKRPEELRSHRWYGVGDRKTFDSPLAHRADGLRQERLRGKTRGIAIIKHLERQSTPATRISARAPRK